MSEKCRDCAHFIKLICAKSGLSLRHERTAYGSCGSRAQNFTAKVDKPVTKPLSAAEKIELEEFQAMKAAKLKGEQDVKAAEAAQEEVPAPAIEIVEPVIPLDDQRAEEVEPPVPVGPAKLQKRRNTAKK